MSRLKDILNTMDVPDSRKSDNRWLLRNLAIRNDEHANFHEAICLIKEDVMNPNPTTPKTIREVLVASMKRVYFNGSTDVKARENGVIPNDTKIGEVQIDVMVDQALTEITQIEEECAPGDGNDSWDAAVLMFKRNLEARRG